MWRRWNNYNGNRGPSIGHPTLIETTVDEGYLETIPEVDSVKSKRSSGMTLPDLPFRAVAPNYRVSQQQQQQQHREPPWSQPSPTIPEHYVPQEQGPHEDQLPDISPVSSPLRSHPDTSTEDVSISPIEPEKSFGARLPLPKHEYRSRIPQRVVSDKNKKIEISQPEKPETRWDAYSGEPTTDSSGFPSSVRPGVAPLEHQYPQLKERTKQILAGLRDREALNKPTWNQQPPPIETMDPLDRVIRKEPWKGPSGRTALVDPVQNNPSARSGPTPHSQRPPSRTKPEPIITRADSPSHTLRSVASEESIKPVAPLKIATKSRNPSSQSSSVSSSPPFYDTINSAPPMYQHPKTLQSPFSSPGPTYEADLPALPTATRADSPYDALPHTPRTPRTPTPPAIYQNTTEIKVQQTPNEPDVSRFSWTTYATSVTESPGSVARIIRMESPPPPVPQVPELHVRKRPSPDADMSNPVLRKVISPSQSSIIIRKPVGGNRPSSGAAFSELSLSKTLPQIPPEAEATDRIAAFEAQMDALAMRKHNTTRIIRDLHESLKKNAIVYDLWKRRDVGERIANHEKELQSITNEEHEIGLLLHRAQKKRDSDDFYETPTGLWIRRVTS